MSDDTIPTRIEGPLALETEDVRKRYGRRTALEGASLTVPPGSVYVLVGPNGAGKTTLMRTLLDLARPEEGSARVLGHDSVAEGAEARACCGYLPEREDAGYGWMTVRGLLAHHASYRPTWDPDYAAELLERLGVRDHTRFGRLSKGEARRAQLVMALAHRPPVLLLDEPTDGLDPVMREEALRVLSDHVARTEATLLVSTHLVYEVEGLADHLGVLREGSLRAQLSRRTLRDRLHRYTMTVPREWRPPPTLEQRTVARKDGGREAAWTVWGARPEILGRLTEAGADVRDVESVSLEETAVALLTRSSTPTGESRTSLEVVA